MLDARRAVRTPPSAEGRGLSVTVLVVEDDAAVRRGVADVLRAAGHDPQQCARGDEAVEAATRCAASLVLLDVALPGCDGFAVLAALRARRPRLPVIMLTARGDEADRVRGLNLGADDYVVKPFSARELLARVEAVLRRAADQPVEPVRLRLGSTHVDLARLEVQRPDGEVRALTAADAALLRLLAAHRGRAVDRRELLRQLWACDPAGIRTRTVDMQVLRLRERIEPVPSDPRFVVTVRGRGYALGREVET
jgi:DNA-binding response OmpR family regulator